MESVLENAYMGPTGITFATQPSVRYKLHKYGTVEVKEDHKSAWVQCIYVKPLRFFGRVRDQYIKAMNEMTVGSDFAGLSGYYGAFSARHDCSYTMERCLSLKERQEEALQEELAALMRLRARRSATTVLGPSFTVLYY